MKPLSTLLPVAVALITLGACGSSGTKTVVVTERAGTGPTTVATATTTTATSGSVVASPPASKTVHLTTFRSPSGNIGCVMLGGAARCDISKRTWKPPARPATCPNVVDFGQGLSVGGSGPGRLVCAGDTALDPSGTPLPYGQASAEGKLTCASATTGMTCTNRADGHGFFISRQSYRVF